jgi:hypothetical protein
MHSATMKISKGELIGFNLKGQTGQTVESFTERHRTDKFFSVQDFQSISVEQ